MKSNIKIAIFCAVVAFVGGVFWTFMAKRPLLPTLTYSLFLEQVRAEQIAGVTISIGSSATQATCRLKDGRTVLTILPADYRDALIEMQNHAVNVEIQDSPGPLRLVVSAAPVILLIGLWIFLINRKFPRGSRWPHTASD